MTQVRKHLQGRRPVQTFSRSRVQPVGDGIQFPLGIARQVRPLRQILPQLAIGVLVGATLPGDYVDPQRTLGWPVVAPGARVPPSLSPDHRSTFCAGGSAHA